MGFNSFQNRFPFFPFNEELKSLHVLSKTFLFILIDYINIFFFFLLLESREEQPKDENHDVCIFNYHKVMRDKRNITKPKCELIFVTIVCSMLLCYCHRSIDRYFPFNSSCHSDKSVCVYMSSFHV